MVIIYGMIKLITSLSNLIWSCDIFFSNNFMQDFIESNVWGWIGHLPDLLGLTNIWREDKGYLFY